MERLEKTKRNLYEYPFSIKTNNFKTEAYPVRYPDRYYLLPSTRIILKPTLSGSSNECPETSSSLQFNQTKRVEDLLATPIVLPSTMAENKTPQLNTRSNKLATRKCRPRNTARYMTQPITLIEIKELEEDAAYTSSMNTKTET